MALCEQALSALPLLADVASYSPCTFQYTATTDGMPSLTDWIGVFRASIPSFKTFALKDAAVPALERQQKADDFETRCDFLFVLVNPWSVFNTAEQWRTGQLLSTPAAVLHAHSQSSEECIHATNGFFCRYQCSVFEAISVMHDR